MAAAATASSPPVNAYRSGSAARAQPSGAPAIVFSRVDVMASLQQPGVAVVSMRAINDLTDTTPAIDDCRFKPGYNTHQ